MFGEPLVSEFKIKPLELKPLTPEQVQKVAGNALDAASDFMESKLQDDRETADLYYQGKTELPQTEGRSKIVVSKVRDAVKSVIPSVARVFTQTDTIIEFWSDDEEDQVICADTTKFCNNIYEKHGGYLAVIEASTDSLKAKIGIVKVTAEEVTIPVQASYDASADMSAISGVPTEASDTETIVTRKSKRTKWNLHAIPPEEFLINQTATCVDDAYIVAHRAPKRIAELIALGFSYDELKDLDLDDDTTEKGEREDRAIDLDDESSPNIDPTSRLVTFTEAYLRIDSDGDGLAELRRLSLGGTKYKLLADEPVNFAPFAIFKSEIQPHVLHPICLAEDSIQDQDAQTALLRSIVDNTALVNSPRTVVNETAVNMDDILSGEIGAIIRARQMGQIEELATPFVAGQTLPVLQYMNEVAEARTGITKLSQGLSGDELQSTTAVAAAASVSGSDSRLEMMARNIGETGLKAMFMCILKTAIYVLKKPQSIRVGANFKLVDPCTWHDQLSLKCNVGMGSGRIEEKKAILAGSVIPAQQAVLEKLGMSNPICGYEQVRNSYATLLRLSGIHEVNKYFPFVPPEVLQKVDADAQAASAAGQKQAADAQMAQMQAMNDFNKIQSEKNQLKYQTDIAALQQKSQAEIQSLKLQLVEAVGKRNLETTKMYLEDDRVRDKNDMDFVIDAKKVDLSEQEIENTEAEVAAQRVNGSYHDVQ
jgi:hypothetical protein